MIEVAQKGDHFKEKIYLSQLVGLSMCNDIYKVYTI